MKILHVITLAELGGAQSVLINICNLAVKDGHKVYVASAVEGPMWNLLDDRIEKIKIKNLSRKIEPLADLKVYLYLKKLYRTLDPEVIHLHSSKIGILGRLAFPKDKIIYTVHGFDSVRIANRKFLILEKLLQKQAASIVAVSEYDKTMLLHEGISHKIEVIYNGIDDFRDKRIPFECDKFHSLEMISEQHVVIMTIARLSPQKKFHLFCEIAEQYQEDNRYRFVWIGNKDSETISNIKNIIMMGEIDNASYLLRFADIFLLPSNYEGLPISILEALSFEKPVVASNVGGIPEILNSYNGFVSENTPQDFKKYIDIIMGSEKTYFEFAKSARMSFEKYFTVEKMYIKYLELYHKIYK